MNCKGLLFICFLLAGCSVSSSLAPNIQSFVGLTSANDNERVSVIGYYWPSYEGSVICQSTEYENCLYVVMNERQYKRYLNKFDKGQLLRVRGQFQWVDTEGYKKSFEDSGEIIMAALWHHRIVNITRIKAI